MHTCMQAVFSMYEDGRVDPDLLDVCGLLARLPDTTDLVSKQAAGLMAEYGGGRN